MSILCAVLCRVRFANVIVFLHHFELNYVGKLNFRMNAVASFHFGGGDGARVDFEILLNLINKRNMEIVGLICIAIRACGFKVQIKCTSIRFISSSLHFSCSTPKAH